MEQDAYYEALCSHDSRFDGKFFVGVVTTGIYCRPICRVRTPKAQNCVFFRTAAEAERAGFRPCLKCRPELAPGTTVPDAGADLAQAAARELSAACGEDESLAELAARLGCTDRHLRRVFEAEFHVTPLQYRQTCRLLLAKNLLTDTDLPILDVAMASGFGSLRRFNDVFKREYRLTPGDLRRQRAKSDGLRDGVTVEIGYRPPYRWQELLRFLAARAIPDVEAVDGNTYLRTAALNGSVGWIMVGNRPADNTLTVTVSRSLLRALPQVMTRVRRLFDTDSDPQLICHALQSMEQIHTRLPIAGLRTPGCFDPFETSVRAILGQQVTVKAAGTMAGRLARAFGTPVETGIGGLDHIFPTPDRFLESRDAAERMGSLGIIGTRAGAILALADLTLSGAPMTREKLLSIKGIGPWTADYIAMRTQGHTDVFLPTDFGVKTALAPRPAKEMTALAEAWRPWRSYAVMNLWNI